MMSRTRKVAHIELEIRRAKNMRKIWLTAGKKTTCRYSRRISNRYGSPCQLCQRDIDNFLCVVW